MSLLTIMQDVCDRIGLPRPSAVIGSSDHQVRQMLGLANQVGKSLLGRHDWQDLVTEKTFTATATETQTSAIPAAFERMVPKTFWNRTQGRRVIGPLSAQRWQQIKSGLITQPWDSYRIRADALLMTPTPTAGDSMAYEYITKYWCMPAAGTTPTQNAWTADTDISIWDDEVHVLGLHWRYLASRGLEYAEPFNAYEREASRLIGNDGGITDIVMADDYASSAYDPAIADGSWGIS